MEGVDFQDTFAPIENWLQFIVSVMQWTCLVLGQIKTMVVVQVKGDWIKLESQVYVMF